MAKLQSQQDYWNSRAAVWGSYAEPLIPPKQDLDFVRKHLAAGGNTLVLGATPELCSLALETSKTVTAVDFAEDVIEALRLEGVRYECADWFEFFERSTERFDTILTDGGLVCLEFPTAWQRIAQQVHSHLNLNGVFLARIYVSIPQPPKDIYENPMLGRFVTSMGNVDANWMVHPKHGDYEKYDMRYAFPPEQAVLQTFDQFTLQGKLVPDYEEGQRFLSFAWRRV